MIEREAVEATSAPERPAWPVRAPAGSAARLHILKDEAAFYESYPWAVNALPTLAQACGHLAVEIGRLRTVPADWRRREVMTNVWLLSCGIADTLDDFLLGERYDLSKAAAVPGGRLLLAPVEKALRLRRWARDRRLCGLMRWRDRWDDALDGYLRRFLAHLSALESDAAPAAAALEALLDEALPPETLRLRVNFPSAFRSQDLTVYDLVRLANTFAIGAGDRNRPVLVAGCRTAGSYFAPLLRACLQQRGWERVDSVTIRPNKGASRREQQKLDAAATSGALVVLTDEPIGTGSTVIKTIRLLQRAGIAKDNLVALLPVHAHNRDYRSGPNGPALRDLKTVRLEPEERHRHRALKAEHAERALRPYFESNGETIEAVSEHEHTAALDALATTSYYTRTKRLYDVRVRRADGSQATRTVLGKSVGFGWLSYHAFIAAVRLAPFVTPAIGLRDGILYSEWLPQQTDGEAQREAALRARIPAAAGRYIAARTLALRLPIDVSATAPAVDHRAQHELSRVLCKAYGKRGPAFLQRERILQELRSQPCPVPTLIDGKMCPRDWVLDGTQLRKSDFEHHAQGKLELNACDPAYDLADTILTWHLSPAQERELLDEYKAGSGDDGVEKRLFHYKLLAGTWTMARAIDNLADPKLAARHAEFDAQYTNAYDFLTEHTTRYCAALYERGAIADWQGSLAVLDIDGVIDDQIFGFPASSAAAVAAISLLQAHGYAIVFDSARSLRQLKHYAECYGAVGVVAEYGAAVWDASSGASRTLVSDTALTQLDAVKAALRELPGVFVNAGYRHSIRAHAYERGARTAVPSATIASVLARVGAGELRAHDTATETTIVARATDKGTGLTALLELAGVPAAKVAAVGDSAPDLAMFAVAERSFAPGHIDCRSAAESLGCRVASARYQNGFLESVRAIVHPGGERCERCAASTPRSGDRTELFARLLEVIDRPLHAKLLGAVAHPAALTAFRQQ